jgi:DNA-binding SARP family transcriptional activator
VGSFSLSLLGGFELRSRGQAVRLAPSAQRVVAFLALHQGSLQRVFVAGSLWEDSSEARAHANLRATLWRLRGRRCPVVRSTLTHIALAPNVMVDVPDLAASALRVIQRAGRDGDFVRLSSAGELLPDWYEEWVIPERERLRQLRLHALDCLCEALTDSGRYAEAVDAALAAIAFEPLRESAHRALIRAHLAEGNVSEALRQYRAYCELSLARIGRPPSAEMEALIGGRSTPVTVL